ncbi:hypothetical protein [Actinomadura meridiana]
MTEFAATMSHINQQTLKVNEKLNELVTNINKVLAKLPSFIAHRLTPLLDKLGSAVTKLWKEFSQFVAEPGDWGKLADAAGKFSDKVQAPVSAQAGRFQETYSKVDDYWKGEASEAYKKVLKPNAPQTAATQQYGDTAEAVSGALDLCRWTILGFWLFVGAAYATLIYQLIGDCVAAASVAGALPALGSAILAIGAFAAAVAGAGWTAIQVLGGPASTFRTENNGNNNWPGGAWPPSGVVAG